jgi:hypothetical protein
VAVLNINIAGRFKLARNPAVRSGDRPADRPATIDRPLARGGRGHTDVAFAAASEDKDGDNEKSDIAHGGGDCLL